ncbi:replication protein B [Levilactobacillus brevis]|jgi:IS30 family transposase|uniref:replication protein B n=1 Tax=Levilactobacillus brevis TaxID=1580 RepID=UPI001C1F0045|nr:replication protein B [Levilactobacillus brevis]MDN5584527.1 replication protein B [Lactobacillus sp.]MDN6029994.1 replication protein B [Lactococcus plantarum]MBU7540758.1 replication protein B [Levilactobacillus brevis]MBU7560084.1 replication protein B [Levilactobacillus brevis]MBU7566923.1 replication protein B [Levilactobacillus brevis]
MSNNKNGYSIKKIADLIGVSKMKVYRTITRNHYKEQYKVGQTLYFDETVKNLLEKELKEVSVTEDHNTEQKDYLVDELKDRVQSQQEQIVKLTRLLDQSQQLQLMAENKIKQLENKMTGEQDKKESAEEPVQTSNVDNTVAKAERGFWSRLFKW